MPYVDLVKVVLVSVLKEKRNFVCENSRKQMSELESLGWLYTVDLLTFHDNFCLSLKALKHISGAGPIYFWIFLLAPHSSFCVMSPTNRGTQLEQSSSIQERE